jgi:hypothetical protein
VKAWIETIWPQIYSKPVMNANKLVSEQFATTLACEPKDASPRAVSGNM